MNRQRFFSRVLARHQCVHSSRAQLFGKKLLQLEIRRVGVGVLHQFHTAVLQGIKTLSYHTHDKGSQGWTGIPGDWKVQGDLFWQGCFE